MRKVIITGILGQDGSNMADYLLSTYEDIEVYGVLRRYTITNTQNIDHLKDHPRFHLEHGDLSDGSSINKLVKDIEPTHFINFAANSFVGTSWKLPEQIFDINTLGVVRCLEAILAYAPLCRFYSAGSSEEFGDVINYPQNEDHPVNPKSPYGASKAAARHLVKAYRDSYGLFAVHGIVFNHEGPRRGIDFVTRKITNGVANIEWSLLEGEEITPIKLGNIFSKRDWSDSRDIVRGIWLMLNAEEAKSYVLASESTKSIIDFVESAFKAVGIEGYWINLEEGNIQAKFIEVKTGKVMIEIDPKFYRPAEIELHLGDCKKAREELGWTREISFDQMVADMVEKDRSIIRAKYEGINCKSQA